MSRFTTTRRRRYGFVAIVAILALALSSCAAFGRFGDQLSQAFNGQSATVRTFGTDGELIDEVRGTSIRISRDDRFDTSAEDKDSSVLLISIGDKHMGHVGSTLILAQDGLTEVASPGKIKITNNQSGTPWLNDLIERWRNNTSGGKAKIVLIRSQLDRPIAVYAGDQVEKVKTDTPKSTWYRIDGKNLVVYRANVTDYDTDLLTR